MIKNFNIGIKAVIVKQNKALVLKEKDIRDNGVQLYDLPGGRIEDEELPEETLKRELMEELGVLEFTLGSILHIARHARYDKNGSSLMLIFYEVFIKDTQIRLSDEHISFEWISKKDLENITANKEKMHNGIKTALEKVLK